MSPIGDTCDVLNFAIVQFLKNGNILENINDTPFHFRFAVASVRFIFAMMSSPSLAVLPRSDAIESLIQIHSRFSTFYYTPQCLVKQNTISKGNRSGGAAQTDSPDVVHNRKIGITASGFALQHA
jgi:hypothetical protein